MPFKPIISLFASLILGLTVSGRLQPQTIGFNQGQGPAANGARTFLANIQRLELLNRWGQPVKGLRMSILEDDEDGAELSDNPAWQEWPHLSYDCKELGGLHCGPDSSTPASHGKEIHLLLEIRNDGDQNAAIIIGGGCGIRATGVTSDVDVSLTDSRGTSFALRFLGIGPPYQGGCAGAGTGFFVTINAHKSFAAVLDLGKYINLSGNQSYEMYRLPAGIYGIQAQLELRSSPLGGATVESFGTLTSNTIQVQFQSDFSIVNLPRRVAP